MPRTIFSPTTTYMASQSIHNANNGSHLRVSSDGLWLGIAYIAAFALVLTLILGHNVMEPYHYVVIICSLIGVCLRIYILHKGNQMEKDRLRNMNIVSHVLCIPLPVLLLILGFLVTAMAR